MESGSLARGLAKLWAPPPKLTVSQWADTSRQLSREASAQGGQWKTRPYQREPMDVFTDPSVHTIVLMVARQTLKTEVELNALGYAMDQDPGPILVVQFRDTDCKKFSKIRLGPMLRDTPCLRGKLSSASSKTGDNTVEYKAFPGGHLSIVASASPGNLAALPIRYLLCDEIDKYPAAAGDSGDPISLAQGRQEEFWNRKTILACTPTVRGKSRIERAWLESDQREYEIPCPFCGHFQITRWEQARWDSELPRHKQAASARYYCEAPECGAAWNDVERWNAVKRGRYKATAPFNGIAGFRVSGLCRLGTKLSALVNEWNSSSGNQQARKTFIQEQLAETWYEPGETLEWERLVERREEYPVAIVPAGGLFLAIGADVQRADGGRIEAELLAFGENRETWSVDYRKFYGDPSLPMVWADFEKWALSVWPHECGGELTAERVFVDSGDGTITPFVYDWVSRQPKPRVWAIKAHGGYKQPVGDPQAVEGFILRSGKKMSYGPVLRILDPNFFKSQFYADLKKRPPTPDERAQGMAYPQGYYHMPNASEYGDEHCKQLCSEQLVTKSNRKGRRVTEWEQTRQRNEALDCHMYAMAGGWDFGAHRFQPRHWQALKDRVRPTEKLAAPVPKPQVTQSDDRERWIPRRKNWLSS